MFTRSLRSFDRTSFLRHLARLVRFEKTTGNDSNNLGNSLYLSRALPALRRIHDRDSEIHCCGTISMHVLRFFLTRPSAAMQGRAPALRCIRVVTPGPRPFSLPSANPPAVLRSTAHRPDWLFWCLPKLLRPKPPFKSHSAPRPPQTPAASS